MIACVSRAPDALRTPTAFLCSAQRLNSEDASFFIHKCTNITQFKQIHAKIIRSGLSNDQLLVRKMIQVCSSHGKMDYASRVFNQIERPQTFTWNLMIRACTMSDGSQQAILLYNHMICGGFSPDKFTFPFVVKACTALFVIDKGKEVHGLAIKVGLYKDTFLQNALMNLYFKCGDKDDACRVFKNMLVRSVVSWTTMISGLIASGDLEAARGTLEHMPHKNVVSWSAIINGYVKHKQPQEAFELFRRMQLDDVEPNEFTLVSLLKACTELGSLKLGKWIHDYALKNGFKLGVFLGTALIDMYSKCGSLVDARLVFDEMQIKSLATWNAMITSLGVHGCGEEALALFGLMKKTNVAPDPITFVGVLSACVHVNDLDKAYEFFTDMKEHYGITPIAEHYTCLIELYRRASMQDEALKLLSTLPVNLKDNILEALLQADDTQGVRNMDKLSYADSQECTQMSACSSYQYELKCFKWDVG